MGVRRLLVRENIYTIKLVARRHFIPKALHANMFLVRPAGDVMDKDFLVLPADMPISTNSCACRSITAGCATSSSSRAITSRACCA